MCLILNKQNLTNTPNTRKNEVLKERLELTEFEINKITKELVSLYEQIAIKENSAPAVEHLYDAKCSMLTQLMLDRKVIKEILKKNPNA